MTKNTITDMNNILFETLEYLNDRDLTDEEFKKEKSRAKEISNVCRTIIDGQRLMFDVYKKQLEYGTNSQEDNIPEPLKLK